MTPPTPSRTPRVGVGAMIVRGETVLLGKRRSRLGQATYGWAGGHVEFGETLEEAAAREVLEETGLVVTALRLLCISNIIAYNSHYIDIEFLAEVAPGEPQICEPEVVESWAWYPLDDLPGPLFKAAELALLSYHSGTLYHPGGVEG